VAIPEARQSAKPSGAKPAERRAPAWLPPRDGWIAIAGVALLYAAHWFYGALISDTAMAMNIAAAVMLTGILASPRLRDDVLRLKGLAAPAVCLALVVLVALWTLTPWTPGGPHPVWSYVGIRPGASTIDKSATTMEILKLLGLACVFVVGAATGARDDRARYAVRLTIWAGVAFGLWAFLGSASGAIYQTQGRRLEAHFLNPNTAGTVFAVLLMLAMAELVRSARGAAAGSRLTRLLPMSLACLTFAVCLLDSASRGAMLALLGAAVVYVALQLLTGNMKASRALGGALVGLGALAAVVSIAGEQLMDRLFESHEASVLRGDIWRVHWKAFLDSPLFGYGLGTAETVNKSLLSLSNVEVLRSIRAILNVYLQWIEEAGVVGAAPMFLCIALLIALTFRGMLRRSRMRGLLASLLAVDALVLIHGGTDFGLEVPSVAAMWAWLLGIQFALAQGSSRR